MIGTHSVLEQPGSAPRRVTLLTNFVPPYRLSLFKALESRLRSLLVLISTPMEKNRPWSPKFDGLNVVIQKTITLHHVPRHPHGFTDNLDVHVPYDTLWQLWRARPEVVITGELGMRSLQALLYRKSASRSRVIVWATLSEASERGRGRLRRLVRSWVLPRADAVLVNGASGARYVARFGVPADKIFVTPQTSDGRRFTALPLQRTPEESRRLLYVGQLIERKGLAPFLSVLSAWAKAHVADNLEFWLLGDGPERTKLEKTNPPPNLAIRFCGNVSYDDLLGFYAQAGILVLPTLADEWGLVVNEAMAAGLPVLGSLYSQAVEELVEEGLTGWTFHPDRAEEMYQAVDRALTASRENLEEMRVSARSRVEDLTPEFVAGCILQAIRFVHPESGASG